MEEVINVILVHYIGMEAVVNESKMEITGKPYFLRSSEFSITVYYLKYNQC